MEKAGCVPSVVTFNALIDGLCKSCELQKARLMFYKMEIGKNPSLFLRLTQGSDRVVDSGSLQTMVTKLSGILDGAFNLFKELQLSGISPDSVTYGTLINGLQIAGREDDAFMLLEEMCLRKDEVERAVRLLLDMDIKLQDLDSAPYTIWLIGFCQARKTTEALMLLSVLKEYNINLTPASCVMLISTLYRQGKLSFAVEVFRYLKDIYEIF
ncbi:pentatricopeptide repeat-containing protein [Tanacetum coccineum]